MAVKRRRALLLALAGAALLAGAGLLAGYSQERQGESRRLLQEVCLGYDDLRFRDNVQLEPDPVVRRIHRRANEVCDLVDEGRAAAAERDQR